MAGNIADKLIESMIESYDQRWVAATGTLIDLAAAVMISTHALRALFALARSGGIDRARLIVANGVLAALAFSVAGALLKTIALQSWRQIGIFVFTFALRAALKRVFAWERRMIAFRLPQ